MNATTHLKYMLYGGVGLLAFALVAGVSLETALPLAILLACPLMMVFMMAGGHGGGHGDDHSSEGTRDAGRSGRPTVPRHPGDGER
jgi:hypothetical protein